MTTETKITFVEKSYKIRILTKKGETTQEQDGMAYGDTGLGYHLCPCKEGFVVDHIPTGYKVLGAHFTKSKIQPFVRGLAEFNIPWEKTSIPKFNEAYRDRYSELQMKYAIFTNWDH